MFTADHPVYNLRFALICFSSLFFSASYNMLIPELPAYLTSLGGADYKGFIIALFTLTAGLSRPVSGRLTDTIGRKPVLAIGTLVCLACGFLYPLLGSVAGFLLLRLFHGFSTGFGPTAMMAYLSDIVPAGRRGEAFGWQGLFFGMGMALGPALGSLIRLYYSFDILFYSSSAMAFLSFALVINLKETLPEKKAFSRQTLKFSRRDVFAAEVLSPSVITFLTYLSFGMVLTLIPDWSGHLGVVYKGLFFVIFTVASLATRLVAGRLSDNYGRVPLIYAGLVILTAALVALGYFQSFGGLVAGSVVYGLAMGILSPAINAWTIDLSRPESRGKALATMFIGLEAGIGLGALGAGFYYRNEIARVPEIMYACAATSLIAIVFLQFSQKRASGETRSNGETLVNGKLKTPC